MSTKKTDPGPNPYCKMTDEELFQAVDDSFDDAGNIHALTEIRARLLSVRAQLDEATQRSAALRAAVETIRRAAVEALS